MYGLWYVFFGFLALAAAGGICILVWWFNEIDWLFYLGATIVVIGGVVCFVLIWFCIFCPINATEEVAKYIEMYPIYLSQAELIKESPDSWAAMSQNSNLIKEIMKYDNWFSSAKASQTTYGCFSKYFNIDLSQLKTIKF